MSLGFWCSNSFSWHRQRRLPIMLFWISIESSPQMWQQSCYFWRFQCWTFWTEVSAPISAKKQERVWWVFVSHFVWTLSRRSSWEVQKEVHGLSGLGLRHLIIRSNDYRRLKRLNGDIQNWIEPDLKIRKSAKWVWDTLNSRKMSWRERWRLVSKMIRETEWFTWRDASTPTLFRKTLP